MKPLGVAGRIAALAARLMRSGSDTRLDPFAKAEAEDRRGLFSGLAAAAMRALEMATTTPPAGRGHTHGRSALHGLPSWVRFAQQARVNVRDQSQFSRGRFATVAGFVTVWDDANDRPGYSRADLRALRAVRGVGSVRRINNPRRLAAP